MVYGSYDQVTPAEQMRVIDEALGVYFGAKDWLPVRRGATQPRVEEPDALEGVEPWASER